MPFSCSHGPSGPEGASAAPSIKYEIVLRRWTDISTAMEFRCFVKNKQLIGISQRDFTNFYPALASQKELIQSEIGKFFSTQIRDIFPLQDYSFDLYRKGAEDILLLDFNPFSPVTDSLMFEWHELVSNCKDTTDTTTAARHVDDTPDVSVPRHPPAMAPTLDSGSRAGETETAGQRASDAPPATDAATTLPPTLTDRLNQKLLTSFLERVNDPTSSVPGFDDATRNADKSAEEDDDAFADPADNMTDVDAVQEETAANDSLAHHRTPPILAAATEPAPVPREPTLTDHLNKKLLTSFLERINNPDSGVQTFAPIEDEMLSLEDAAATEAAADITSGSPGTPAEAPERVPTVGPDVAAGSVQCEMRVVESIEEARMRPSVYINSRVPRDVVDINSAEDIERLARLFREGGLGEDDASDSDDSAANNEEP
eukprot:m.352889 g.352889  ORF g.352889 m.352889 type:complete len:429 (+) comp20715_c0_seq1:135-1421(+)